jgi:chorismate synthase
MAGTDEQAIRGELREERERLAEAVEELRAGIGDATRIGDKLRARLPIAAAAAFGLGFVKGGGVGATMRLVLRRGREADEKAAVGRFRLIRR